MQLLFDECESTNVVSVRETDLVQRFGRERLRQCLDVLSVVADDDNVGNLEQQ